MRNFNIDAIIVVPKNNSDILCCAPAAVLCPYNL
eukprot:CAMPEP_0195333476 /NCGR_PEP_ID=MMETSP0708-20121125/14097_1 /TAXON_ID=33640 /ORGANISM="Asterionellopsis glacialis, Strain CCMP134" /LENGTH=33 /DNA_ID= /DNA_START= /DNA_END= /DNA_ORIENTATION=